jgi:GNAT superfamily N-acetyltransferase
MSVTVRPLREHDLPIVERIFRLAFGTYVGLPEPLTFAGDSDWTRTRWLATPDAAFVAERDGEIVGSNFGTRWGSVATFGPLSVRPNCWDHGIAQQLLPPVLDRFGAWGVKHAGLYTFAQSPKHVNLYAKYGFWPGPLMAVMEKRPAAPAAASAPELFSAVPPAARDDVLSACRQVTDAVCEGLDFTNEIATVDRERFGDTVILRDADELAGFAVCHAGRGTEAGSGSCYVKFAAATPGPRAPARFDGLLAACEAFAGSRGCAALVAGVSMGRESAYRSLRACGFRTVLQGVTMHRPSTPPYHDAGAFVLDDWR